MIVAACEQCGRALVPELLPAVTLDQWLDRSGPEAGDALRLVLDHRAERRLRELSAPTGGVTLLIGPEGGLEETEIAAAERRAGYLPLGLGPRVLRTETAGLAALTALQTLWGTWAEAPASGCAACGFPPGEGQRRRWRTGDPVERGGQSLGRGAERYLAGPGDRSGSAVQRELPASCTHILPPARDTVRQPSTPVRGAMPLSTMAPSRSPYLSARMRSTRSG